MMRGLLFSLLCQQALKRQGRPSGLIGQYKPYLNSNDSPTRDILKDYSGQGHDIQLYNFGYALQSGYGSYKVNFNDIEVKDYGSVFSSIKQDKLIINGTNDTSSYFTAFKSKVELGGTKIKISNLDNTDKFLLLSVYNGTSWVTVEFPTNEVFEIPDTINGEIIERWQFIFKANTWNNVIFEQIPDYLGALVSDGVDDYGLCENFPILTKEKGYTVLYLCKRLKSSDSSYLLSNSGDGLGAFVIESSSNTYNFGNITNIEELQDLFRWQTSKSYCGINSLNIGNNTADDELFLFAIRIGDSRFCKAALYALEIYDHDLTDEEIESVKEAMISEYEKETGNVLEGV